MSLAKATGSKHKIGNKKKKGNLGFCDGIGWPKGCVEELLDAGFRPCRRGPFVSAIGTVQKVRQQGRRQGEGRGVQVCTWRPSSNENAVGGLLGQSHKGPKTISAFARPLRGDFATAPNLMARKLAPLKQSSPEWSNLVPRQSRARRRVKYLKNETSYLAE